VKHLGLLAVLTLVAACSSTSAEPFSAVRGPDAPTFTDASELLAKARRAGVTCGKERTFSALENLAQDGIDYAVPDARTCEIPSGDTLYVVVYDEQQHRIESSENGEANRNLCSLVRSDSWHAIVAGNWRAATPTRTESLAELDAAFEGAPEAETLSCKFEA
jgi:hypothetical protein